MTHQNYNITANAITWDVEETEVSQDEVAFVNISCSGYVSSDATIDQAMNLIPALIPISSTGPVRLASAYSRAQLQKKGARFGDGNIIVTATYRKSVGIQYFGTGGPSDTAQQESPSDKRSLRVASTDDPILSSPVARRFPKKERRALKNLMEGDIKPNDETDETKRWFGYEFVKLNTDTNEWSIEHKFSDTKYSANGVTCSPYEMALCITSGIDSYKNKTIVFRWSSSRSTPASSSELNSVSTVVNPPGAPSVADREWLFEGLNQEQFTEDSFTIDREFILSGPGGWLKQLYKGGTGDING